MASEEAVDPMKDRHGTENDEHQTIGLRIRNWYLIYSFLAAFLFISATRLRTGWYGSALWGR
jgi:hypothetical protein